MKKEQKKLANSIKFALTLKSKTYPPKNSDQTRIKQTDNTSRPHHSTPDTTRPTERDTYAQKLKKTAKSTATRNTEYTIANTDATAYNRFKSHH